MFGSSHFKRGLRASRLMPYQIKEDIVKINAVQRQLCFPLECSKWQPFYVREKGFPHVLKYDKNAPGTDCHGCLLYGFKIPVCLVAVVKENNSDIILSLKTGSLDWPCADYRICKRTPMQGLEIRDVTQESLYWRLTDCHLCHHFLYLFFDT